MGNTWKMNSVLISVCFNILTSSQAEPVPEPDTHIHLLLPPEQSKGQKSPKTGGGFLTSNPGQMKMPLRFESAGTTTPATNENDNDYADQGSVTCGGHRAPNCQRCPDKAPNKTARSKYCHGQCEWGFRTQPDLGDCFPKYYNHQKSVSCGGHRERSCAECSDPYGPISVGPHGKVIKPRRFPEKCHGDCRWGCVNVGHCSKPSCVPKNVPISTAFGFNKISNNENSNSQYGGYGLPKENSGDYWLPKDNIGDYWLPKDNKWPPQK